MTALRRTLASPTRRRDMLWAYIFLAPFILGFFLWQAGPLLLSLYYSFTEYDLLQPERWVGLANYQRMVDDRLFGVSLVNTAIYTAMSVAIYLIFSLGGALLLNAKLRGISFFRLVVYLPSQLPLVASAVIFLWIFEPTFGVANYILQTIGIEPQMWLFDPVLAKPTLAIMGIWGIGTGIIIFLAGLQSVPESLYDAAKVDGAGTVRQFWHVTLPMVSPVILFSLIISIIGSFQVFDLAYIMTQGGPGTETLFYVLYIYRNGFEFFRMGYASALAWVLFLIILALTFINFRASGRWVHYEVSTQ
ncbi:sugar ABC transporter permease [soil metagenome]